MKLEKMFSGPKRRGDGRPPLPAGLINEYFKPFYLEDRANFLSIKVLKRNKKGFHARMLNERKSFDLYMKSSSSYEIIIIGKFSCINLK